MIARLVEQKWLVVALGCLLLPSLGVAQKFFGNVGLLAYGVWVLALTAVAQGVLPRYATKLPARYWWVVNVVVYLTVLVLFFWVYPKANSGQFGGGSDRDDALNIAIRDFLAGHYPYLQRTYLGGPISPLPGSLLLALPFVALGNSAYQNLFWLAVLPCYCIYGWWRKAPYRVAQGSTLWLFLLLGAPIVMQELLTGGDMLANGIFIALFLLLIWQAYQQPRQGWWQWGVMLLLGVGIASRANFALVLAPVTVYLWQQRPARIALLAVLLAALTAIALTLPFYVADPAHFSPLHVDYIAEQFPIFGQPKLVFALGMCAVAILGCYYQWRNPNCVPIFLLSIALPQLLPLLLGLLGFALQHWWQGRFFSYGLGYIWLLGLAAWHDWWQ